MPTIHVEMKFDIEVAVADLLGALFRQPVTVNVAANGSGTEPVPVPDPDAPQMPEPEPEEQPAPPVEEPPAPEPEAPAAAVRAAVNGAASRVVKQTAKRAEARAAASAPVERGAWITPPAEPDAHEPALTEPELRSLLHRVSMKFGPTKVIKMLRDLGGEPRLKDCPTETWPAITAAANEALA